MKSLRTLSLVGVAAGLALSVVAIAPTATAAPSPSTLYVGGTSSSPTVCANAASIGLYSDQAHTSPVTSIAGDGIATIVNDCASNALKIYFPGGWGLFDATNYVQGSSTSIAVISAGTLDVYFCVSNNAGLCDLSGKTLALTIALSGAGSTSSSISGGGPEAILQEFGKPTNGTCDSAQPAGLNWAGVAGGGWGISWSQWVNNHAGGFVCRRVLVYSTSLAQWQVE
jgi:hypothetical protein